MAFKLPPNSLFALLLRKPWWVSLLIAAVLGLVAAALLPAAFRVVGALYASGQVILKRAEAAARIVST